MQMDTAFERAIDDHRAGLEAHCYRMLGSAADAEDALQETLLRAWRGLPRFEGRSSLHTWLYAIATNVCLRAIEGRPKRVLPIDYEPVAEPLWLDPHPDDGLAAGPEARYGQRESIELAFLAAVQHLPARQRAVLLLRDVLGFAPAEIADVLGATPASVYSALQRAHRAVEERLPERSQQATLRALGDRRVAVLVERYVRAWDEADVAAIVALLTEDATFAMPPRPEWYRGHASVAAFLAAGPAARARRWRRARVAANGQLAFAVHDGDTGAAHAIEVLTLAPNARIAAVTSFQGPDALARFDKEDRP